jgi:hypothetical protein
VTTITRVYQLVQEAREELAVVPTDKLTEQDQLNLKALDLILSGAERGLFALGNKQEPSG